MLASKIRWAAVKSADRSIEKIYRSYGNDVSRLVAMCVLQCVAVSCSVLQCVAVCFVAVCCVAVCCVAVWCSVLCCSALQRALLQRTTAYMPMMCRAR